jgi:hypothetical protein
MLNNAKIQKIKSKKLNKGKAFDSDQTFKIDRKLARQSKRFNQYQNV